MNPNDSFKGNKVVSVANLPPEFQIRDPEEYRMDMFDMMDEMGICRECRDHTPCCCEPIHTEHASDITNGDYLIRKHCTNCGTPATKVGGFCSTKCQKEYIGEA